MNDSVFEDIEQDNNPSFYGNQSILTDPYGHQQPPRYEPPTGSDSLNLAGSAHRRASYSTLVPPSNDLINSSIGLSNQIQEYINDPNLKIEIVSSERLVNSSVIVYSIQLYIDKGKDHPENNRTSIIVKRRYSEFKSLRDNLLKLYPTLIIPPIPEKHSIFSFIVNSINNSNEVNIIEMRRRYFKNFLNDLIFESSTELRNCVLLHKFLDPNYELCWYNAINEPPVNLIPDNLLLANPINPIDQNGLYSLFPTVNGFDYHSNIDNLSSLKRLNEDLANLKDQIKLFDSKGREYLRIHGNDNTEEEPDFLIDNYDHFEEIPKNLINFEVKFHHIIKILYDLDKVNARTIKDYKSVINSLIELGGNLNNFSLQIYESSSYQQSRPSSEISEPNSLSLAIEKFGSTIDSNFLNLESFIVNDLIPEWQEPVHQLVQYYISSLHLIKFYKYKVVQYKLLYKLKFAKFQDLMNLSTNPALLASADPSSPNSASNLDHLKDLNSPSLNSTLERIEARKKRGGSLATKKSWYGLFGGNNGYNKQFSQTLLSNEDEPVVANGNAQGKYKNVVIKKELNKLNQLIELTNQDMIKLTAQLSKTYEEFLEKLEKKWLELMIKFIQKGKQ
ncbi:uncharacterized protein CANTADRAFT_27497, partial [Suhomyces tanzawaensis NRRL Y-17324]